MAALRHAAARRDLFGQPLPLEHDDRLGVVGSARAASSPAMLPPTTTTRPGAQLPWSTSSRETWTGHDKARAVGV